MQKEGEKLALWLGCAKFINLSALCKAAGMDRSNLDKYISKGEIPEKHVEKLLVLIAENTYIPLKKVPKTTLTPTPPKPPNPLKSTAINKNTIPPPMPVKKPGENAFDFAAKKSQWKIKYGNQNYN